MANWEEILSGGRLAAHGRSGELAAAIERRPELLREALELMHNDLPEVRMRAADAIETATRNHPEWLAPYRTYILEHLPALGADGWMRLQFAPVLGRIEWSDEEVQEIATTLHDWYYSPTTLTFAKATALTALAELGLRHTDVREMATRLVKDALSYPKPSVAARARKLIKLLEPPIKRGRRQGLAGNSPSV